jgi:hypothetical protein
VLLVERLEHRHLSTAWRAPGRPKIQNDNLAAQCGKVEIVSIELLNVRAGANWPTSSNAATDLAATNKGTSRVKHSARYF